VPRRSAACNSLNAEALPRAVLAAHRHSAPSRINSCAARRAPSPACHALTRAASGRSPPPETAVSPIRARVRTDRGSRASRLARPQGRGAGLPHLYRYEKKKARAGEWCKWGACGPVRRPLTFAASTPLRAKLTVRGLLLTCTRRPGRAPAILMAQKPKARAGSGHEATVLQL